MIYETVEEVLALIQHVVEFHDIPISDINQVGIFGSTPLLIAVEWDPKEGDQRAVELLLNAGADVNAIGENGDTALHRAASRGKLELAKLLISRGAALSVKNDQGNTPLDEAKIVSESALVNYLSGLDHGPMP